ncbi:hypothetical protein V5799_019829, partial [Amblyomma americanum]
LSFSVLSVLYNFFLSFMSPNRCYSFSSKKVSVNLLNYRAHGEIFKIVTLPSVCLCR